MSDFILNPADEFIPDPIWLIDMLRNDLKQLDQMDGAPEEDVQLYEWTLALIGLLFPDAVWYALEAFQEVFLARMKEEKTSGPRHRPEACLNVRDFHLEERGTRQRPHRR